MVSFKVTDFYVSPAALVAELQIALPGCEMEQDEEAGENGESEAWSCESGNPGSSGTPVEAYFAPGLVLLEIGSSSRCRPSRRYLFGGRIAARSLSASEPNPSDCSRS